VEQNSGLQPYDAREITVDVTTAYRADYRARAQDGTLVGLRIAYWTRGKTGFIVANIARLQEFAGARKTFNRVISSFRLLSSQQAARIPLHRLKVYRVQKGDTFPSISRRFYRTPKYADDIKQLNGMEEHNAAPPVGTLMKIKPLLPETVEASGE